MSVSHWPWHYHQGEAYVDVDSHFIGFNALFKGDDRIVETLDGTDVRQGRLGRHIPRSCSLFPDFVLRRLRILLLGLRPSNHVQREWSVGNEWSAQRPETKTGAIRWQHGRRERTIESGKDDESGSKLK